MAAEKPAGGGAGDEGSGVAELEDLEEELRQQMHLDRAALMCPFTSSTNEHTYSNLQFVCDPMIVVIQTCLCKNRI
jgi:hypothetical protein